MRIISIQNTPLSQRKHIIVFALGSIYKNDKVAAIRPLNRYGGKLILNLLTHYAFQIKHQLKNDKLPTNEHEHQKYEHKPQFCKQCKQDIVETDDHIIKCFCAPRKTLRAAWLSEVKEFLSNKHTPEDVSDAIYYGLDKWLEPKIVGEIEPEFGIADLAM